jgi:predicted O-methyltransferase YrrM
MNFGVEKIPDTVFGQKLRQHWHIYEEIQQKIGPISGCGSYLHDAWDKNYAVHTYEKQEALFEICQKLPIDAKVLEIGVFDGSSALLMLMAHPTIHIIGIDICENDYPETAVAVLNRQFANRYTLVRGSSGEEINRLPAGSRFDLVHIDGDHNYEGINSDILNVRNFVDDKTIVVLDDIDNYGVANAIEKHRDLVRLRTVGGRNSCGVFRFPNPPKACATIVTALYDIRRHETGHESLRTIEQYLTLGQFLFSLPYPMVVFTEPHLYSRVDALRKNYKRTNVLIIVEPFEETFFYRDLARLAKLQKSYIIENLNVAKDTPRYIALNNNKFHFMEKVLTLNPFSTSHFCWIDFGITHNAKTPEAIHRWFNRISDRVRQLEIIPYIEDVPDREYFRLVRHNLAGSLFSGSREYLMQYVFAYKYEWQRILSEGWYQLDEAVMAIVAKNRPELFDVYFGDYAGLLTNFDQTVLCDAIASQGLQKALDLRNYEKAHQIARSFEATWMFQPHRQLKYAGWRIIIDFYRRKGLLGNDVIHMLLEAQKACRPGVVEFVRQQKGNLELYKNVDELLRLC